MVPQPSSLAVPFDARRAARSLIARGISVFPIPAPSAAHDGKKPASNWREFQTRAMGDEEVEQAFQPGDNIAVVTGAISDLVVVDTDSKAAEAWAVEHLPATPWAVKTSKGLHRYYRRGEKPVANGARVLDGLALDIRGDGGYVVGPGSRHASGARYEPVDREGWATPKADLPVFDPAWLPVREKAAAPQLRLVEPAQPALVDQSLAIRRAEADMKTWDACPDEGQGSDGAVFYRACRLVRDFMVPPAVAVSLLLDWTTGARQLDGSPFEPAWIEHKVEQAQQNGTRPPGQALLREQRSSEQRSSSEPRAERSFEGPAPAPKRFASLSAFLSLADLCSRPAPRPVIHGALDEGLVFLAGAPGCGKTFTALSFAVAVASGRSWLGHRVEQGAVLYMNGGEGSAMLGVRLAAAVREAGLDPAEPLPLFVQTDALPLNDPAAVDALIERAQGQGFKLLIVDTLQRHFLGDENSQKDVSAFVAGCDRLRQALGCAVLVTHHTGKSGETVRGSSVIQGSADQILFCEKSGDLLSLTTGGPNGKRKDGDEIKLDLRLARVEALDLAGAQVFDVVGDPLTTAVVKTSGDITSSFGARSSERRANDARVLEAVERLAGSATKRKVEEATGLADTTLRDALKRLVSTNEVDNAGRAYTLTSKCRARLDAERAFRRAEAAMRGEVVPFKPSPPPAPPPPLPAQVAPARVVKRQASPAPTVDLLDLGDWAPRRAS